MYKERALPFPTSENPTSTSPPFFSDFSDFSDTSKPRNGSQEMSDTSFSSQPQENPLQQSQSPEKPYLANLYQVVQQVHRSLDISRVIEHALTGMIELFGARSGLIGVLDQKGELVSWLLSDETLALTENRLAQALQTGVLAQVLHHQRILRIGDTTVEYGEQVLPGRSLLIIPFQAGEAIKGVLLLSHPQPHAFASPPEQIIAAAAESLGLALHNAWQHQQVQNKEREREMMVNMLVHDVRSPLMATSASLDVINRALEEHPVDEKLHEFIQDSLLSGKRGLQEVLDLTNDLLDVKKLQSGRYGLEYQPVMVDLLYDEIYRLLYGLAVKRKVIIRYQVRPRSLKVEADARLLRRALINLVINALRFSPGGSTITMKADTSAESNLIKMDAQPSDDGKGVLFVVEDRGPGVAPADRTRIFHPFAQARGEAKRGTGLGLAFCYEVALAHNGRIWVEERPGGGSRFCIEIPSQQQSDLP